MASLAEVAGTYRDAQNNPASGRVVFALTEPLRDMAGNILYDNQPISVDLDANGSVSVTLVVTQDPTISPQGVTYAVTEQIDYAETRTWYLAISSSDPVNLAAVSPAIEANPRYAYILESTFVALSAGLQGQPRFSGIGPPGTIIGSQSGDSYLNTANGDLYTFA